MSVPALTVNKVCLSGLNAITKALGREGLSPADVDLFENEAFAAVALQSMRDLGVGPDVVNVDPDSGVITGQIYSVNGGQYM